MTKHSEPSRPSGEERRKHPRLSDIFIVTYHLKTPLFMEMAAEGREFAGVGMDLCEAGLGADVARPIAVGVLVKMKFRLVNSIAILFEHQERNFQLEGECRYCQLTPNQNYRVGISFKNATQEDVDFIGAYVKDQTLVRSG